MIICATSPGDKQPLSPAYIRPALIINAERVQLDVSQAVPCGLVVSEIISNAYKHAFPPGRSAGCEIRVSLRLDGDNRVECTVCDNGIGIPAGLDPRSITRSDGAW